MGHSLKNERENSCVKHIRIIPKLLDASKRTYFLLELDVRTLRKNVLLVRPENSVGMSE